jgi:ketosteroid isomerase-like protein
MSENLDLARSIFADWERGDFTRAEWAHPEIEFVSNEASIPFDPTTGAAEIWETWHNWLRAWKDFRVEADEYREVDGERVLVLLHYSGRGSPGGQEITPIEAATLLHIRDGKVARLSLYWDRERALADLGIEG